jgi:hypothetical protein
MSDAIPSLAFGAILEDVASGGVLFEDKEHGTVDSNSPEPE